MGTLVGKVAIVTGGTRGIGRAIVEALLDAGASVVFCARRAEAVQRALEELSVRAPGRVAALPCDVRDLEQVRELVRYTIRTFGGVDILVNNAGVGIFRSLYELTPEQWREVIETNLTGVFYCCREVVGHMRERGGGYIINISSLAGKNAFAGGAAYNASKFGVNGFSEAIMQDLRYDNIRVSCIMPGSVATEFGGREATAESEGKLRPSDVARVVLHLLEHDPASLPSCVEIRPTKPRRRL
jgi:NAD(P)-dependent dehydrogenase (short-subunit alcohol dehydrogenase family)